MTCLWVALPAVWGAHRTLPFVADKAAYTAHLEIGIARAPAPVRRVRVALIGPILGDPG
jgi:hypothetical protein